MAEQPKDDRFYKPNTLLRAFGISSIVMMVFSIWMILDDFGREWKGYQRKFFQLNTKKYNVSIEEAKKNVDSSQLKQLEQALATHSGELQLREKELIKLEKELTQLKAKEKIVVAIFQDNKASWDVFKYKFEAKYGHKVAEGKIALSDPKAKLALEALQKDWARVDKLRDVANSVTQTVSEKELEIARFFAEKNKIEKQIRTLRADWDKLLVAKESAELTLGKLLRSGPIIDMANPVFRIEQVVLPQIREDIFFAHVQTVDRCHSCHKAIDVPGFEAEPNPFKTHPKLNLILGSTSPHPLDKIGCTVCHSGRGQAVDFIRTGHAPRHEEQRKNWEKKYGWNEQDLHYLHDKMVPLQYVEGKCVACHKQTEYVPKAEKLNAATQLVVSAGCYGCHRIEGYDHLRKPAPSLKRIKGKVTRDWFVKWVRNPKSFNEFSRMPSFFHQSNIEQDEHKAYQEAEIFAITDYLMGISDSYTPNVQALLGNVKRGKELFGKIGCLGCHQIDDFERKRGRFDRAPELSAIGSKVTKGWLASWLHNPRHYWSDTTMPNMRLSTSEIQDLVAYLLAKKNSEFDRLPVGHTDLETQKKVLKLYLMRDPKLAPATHEKVDRKIAEMSAPEVIQSLGASAMMRYGCFGCHEVKGFEKTPGIGTELTEEGSKLVNKLDFGLIHIEHTNHHWFDKKLENPRIFDKGIVKDYLDLLKMPNFYFDIEQRDLLVTLLMGRTSQKIGPPAAKILNSREASVEEGQRIVHRYNCQGCHVVENMFTSLPDDHPGREEHEKSRFHLEGRVLAYFAEDETLGPPSLFGEGEKVLTDWVYPFLSNPSTLRPKLSIRMPTFQMSSEEINKIVTYFGNDAAVEFPFSSPQRVSLTSQQMSTARTLFNRLQCANCHTVGEKLAPSQLEGSKGLAPDLTLAAKRLRRAWIVKWLKDPQKLMPGTRMPGFWPDGNSPAPDILGGDSNAQIELLSDYLIYLGQGRATSPLQASLE